MRISSFFIFPLALGYAKGEPVMAFPRIWRQVKGSLGIRKMFQLTSLII